MAGDTANARIWTNADVYVGAVGATGPTNTSSPIGNQFEALGLLSEDGMVESRDEDVTDHYAWGGLLVRTTRSKHKRTIVVTALEDNSAVFSLVNPGSSAVTAASVTTRTIKVPVSDPHSFVVELRDGTTISRRHIPRGEVVEVGDVTSSDSEMRMFELTINIYPDSSGILYYDITNDPQAGSAS